jgi:glutaminyl-tRNA synthetase
VHLPAVRLRAPALRRDRGVTHSLCTLEFDNNRAIYDWLVERLFDEPRPRQYEFARLQLDRTVLSKRKLIALVREGFVDGWDDPRMPTLAGVRRRGVPPAALRAFVDAVGVTKANSRTDPALLDHAVRDALNTTAPRVMAVLDPVELLLDDPDGELDGIDGVDAPSFPDDVGRPGGVRRRRRRRGSCRWAGACGSSATTWRSTPRPGFKRLAPGRAVRLRHAVVVAATGSRRRERPRRAGSTPGGPGVVGPQPRRRQGVGRRPLGRRGHRAAGQFRLYDHLFAVRRPGRRRRLPRAPEPDVVEVRHGFVEPSVAATTRDTRYQFERLGYFWRDRAEDGRGDAPRVEPDRHAQGRPGAAGPRGRRARAGSRSRPRCRRGRGPGRHRGRQPRRRVRRTAPDPLADLEPGARARGRGLARALGVDAVEAGPDRRRASPGRALLDGAVAAGAPAATAARGWRRTPAASCAPRRRPADARRRGPRRAADLLADGTLHTGSAREVWAAVADRPGRPREVVERRGSPASTTRTRCERDGGRRRRGAPRRGGRLPRRQAALIGFFVGQVMRATGGRADPTAVQAPCAGARRRSNGGVGARAGAGGPAPAPRRRRRRRGRCGASARTGPACGSAAARGRRARSSFRRARMATSTYIMWPPG